MLASFLHSLHMQTKEKTFFVLQAIERWVGSGNEALKIKFAFLVQGLKANVFATMIMTAQTLKGY